jgi:hypothetical protein
LSNCLVTAGGVITDSEYDDAGGSDSASGDGTVVWSRFRMLTLDVRGFSGVAGRECWRYHAKTARVSQEVEVRLVYILLWPYLLGSEDAPATAKRGEEKKVRSATSMFASRVWFLVVGMSQKSGSF